MENKFFVFTEKDVLPIMTEVQSLNKDGIIIARMGAMFSFNDLEKLSNRMTELFGRKVVCIDPVIAELYVSEEIENETD